MSSALFTDLVVFLLYKALNPIQLLTEMDQDSCLFCRILWFYKELKNYLVLMISKFYCSHFYDLNYTLKKEGFFL